MTRDASQPNPVREYQISKELNLPIYYNDTILFNFSVYCLVFQLAGTTEQQHVPSPLQRSRAGTVKKVKGARSFLQKHRGGAGSFLRSHPPHADKPQPVLCDD
ncbi:MAG: hypothetical protein SWH68_09435 [Thermodesulfobacteriota bacterium]|nr:hypothetical protein [Thermodesulfobacteriota bacterium]